MKSIILSFVLHPDVVESKGGLQKWRNILEALKFQVTTYLVYTAILISLLLLQKFFLDTDSVEPFLTKSKLPASRYTSPYFFLLATIVAPVLEETMFRGWLSFKRITIALSVGLSLYSFLKIVTNSYLISVPSGLVAIVGFYLLLPETIVNLIKKHFKFLFYASLFLFAGLHVFNYELGESKLSGPLFLVFLPRLIDTVSLSYLRIRNGLIWSIGYHGFSNAIVYLIGAWRESL